MLQATAGPQGPNGLSYSVHIAQISALEQYALFKLYNLIKKLNKFWYFNMEESI